MVPQGRGAVPSARQGMPRTSFFTNESMIRRVQRESVVALSGPRTLLMQAAHPVAFAGFFAHTGALDDPYARLQRTVRVLGLIGFGDKAEAQKATARVRDIHTRINGDADRARRAASPPARRTRRPTRTCCCGSSPAWPTRRSSSTSATSARCRATSATAFWQDYKVIGREFGLRDADMPEEIEDFERYMDDMVEGDDLFVTDEARELALQIVMRPPVPLRARPMVEVANFVTVGLLPPRVRRMYGFSWDPARALVLRGGAEYAKRVVVPLLPDRLRYRRRRRPAA